MESKPTFFKGDSSTAKSSTNKRRRKNKDNTGATKPLQFKRFVVNAKGRLKILTELPVDVLLEILGHLEPCDLLHTSRANKNIRTLLTSKNTAYLWNQTFENIPQEYRPPDGLPSGVDGQLYTNFLFGNSCQICGSSNPPFKHYLMRIKYCCACAISRTSSAFPYDDGTTYCIKHKEQFGPPGIYCFPFVFCRERERHAREIKQAETQDDETRNALLVKKDKELVVARKKNAEFLSWAKKYTLYPRKLQKDRLQHRRKQLQWRLEGEGYADVILRLRINRLPCAKANRDLGDEEWRYLRADIVDMAQDIRELERETQIQEHLLAILDELQNFLDRLVLEGPSILPTASIVASCASVSGFIQNVPEGQATTQHDFEPFRNDCLKEITSWRDDIDRYLLDLLPLPRPAQSNVSNLNLATTFFKCYFCTEPIIYPRVLMHSCLRSRNDSDNAYDKNPKGKDQAEPEDGADGEDYPLPQGGIYREPRPPRTISIQTVFSEIRKFYPTGLYPGRKGVVFDEESHDFAKGIISACHEDPSTVTFEEMQAKDARLECLACKNGNPLCRTVMTWTMAILHDIECHFEEEDIQPCHWVLVTSKKDLLRVKSLESESKRKSRSPEYTCEVCRTALHSASLVKHLRNIHHLELDVLDRDDAWISDHFVANIDASFKRAPFPVKI